MKRQLIASGLLAVSLNAVLADSAPASSESSPSATATNALSLDAVIREAFQKNPSLRAARENWEAMKERVPQARAWEDLRVGVDAKVGRFVDIPPNSFTDNKYMAEQTLPISGKNRLRGKAAEDEAAAAFAQFRRRELDLEAGARTAYVRLANAHVQLELNRKNIAALKQFAEISRAKYEVGTQTLADVLTAETELAKQEETRFDFERELSDQQSQLNVLMNRPAQSPLGRAAGLTFEPMELSLEQLQSVALAHRPELLVAQKKADAAKARWELAKREWIPDPALRVEADQYNQGAQAISEVIVGISFNVPWLNQGKYRAGIREAKKNVDSTEHEFDAMRTETLGLVRDQLKKVATFHHHYELFRDKILPLARQTVSAKRRNYETDKAGFLDLVTAQLTLQQVESTHWEHLTDYEAALAELEALIGTNPNQPVNDKEGHHE